MEQNTIKGIAIYTLAAFFVTCMLAFGKVLGDMGYHPIEVIFYRSFGGLVILSAYIVIFKKYEALKTSRPKAHIWRSAIGNIGVGLWFWVVTLIPLSTAVSISYIAPVFATILSAIILKEKVGFYRWVAVLFAFSGTLFLVQPSGEEFSYIGIVLAVFGAFVGGVVSITLRSIGSTEKALTTTFYFLLFGSIVSGVMLPFVWTSVPVFGIIFLGFILTGFINQPLKSYAFRIAPASSISPAQYLSIVWAVIIGFLFWQEVPTINIIIGCAIVVSSNLIILWRENKVSKSN